MTKTELLEQFDKKHQGTYTLDDLALLIVEAYNLGEESEWEAIQRVRELHKKMGNVCHSCSTFDTAYLTLYPCPTIKALDGEQ